MSCPKCTGPLECGCGPEIAKELWAEAKEVVLPASSPQEPENQLCECGHSSDSHRTPGSECVAKVSAGNNKDFCECGAFKPSKSSARQESEEELEKIAQKIWDKIINALNWPAMSQMKLLEMLHSEWFEAHRGRGKGKE